MAESFVTPSIGWDVRGTRDIALAYRHSWVQHPWPVAAGIQLAYRDQAQV